MPGPTNTAATAAPEQRLPTDLSEAGWKLSRKLVNDDEEHPVYSARNESLDLVTPASVDLTAVIQSADLMQSRAKGTKPPARDIAAADDDARSFVRGGATVAQVTAPPPEDEAAGPVVKLRISKLRRDGGTQPRAGLNEAKVQQYAEDKRSGAKFPPGVAFYDGTDYWLGRGFHRIAADEENGEKSTEVEVRQGTQRDAILFSLGENATHGLPRTNGEKRLVVLTMLQDPEWSEWSDNVIAQKTRTSQPFVSKLRRALSADAIDSVVAATQNILREEAVLSDDALEDIRPEEDLPPAPALSTRRRGADGVIRETKSIGKSRSTIARVIAAPPKDVSASASAPWPEGQIKINLIINPGKSSKRSVMISGAAGDGKPTFRTDFTAADLEPVPPALRALMGDVTKAFNRAAAKPPAKTSKKPAAKTGKKKPPARKK